MSSSVRMVGTVPATRVRGGNARVGRVSIRCASSSASSSSSEGTTEQPRLIYASSPALEHQQVGHPECAERVPAIEARLEEERVNERYRPGEILRLDAFESAGKEALDGVHVKNYLAGLELVSKTRAPTNLDTAPTYATKSSYDDVMRGVGGAIRLVDEVMDRCDPGVSGFGLISAAGAPRRAERSHGVLLGWNRRSGGSTRAEAWM